MRAPLSLTALFGKRGLGYLPDKPDQRDFLIAAAGLPTTPPKEYVPRHGLLPLYQKGNSCTGRVVQACRIGEVNHDRDPGELSGLDNYYKSRYLWGGLGTDSGSYCREAVRAHVLYGAASAEDWPETAWNVQRKPSARAQRGAHKLRGVRGYFRIPSYDLDSMRSVIASGFCVFGGWRIDRAFAQGDGPTVIDAVSGPDSGGHAFLLDGYGPNGLFHMQNSWHGWRGTQHGPSSAWLTEDFVSRVYDAWAVITDETVVG